MIARGLILIFVGIFFSICLGSGSTVLAQSEDGYIVQPGDTLGEIATRLGVSVDELAGVNGIVDINRIEVGQRLLIPGQINRDSILVSRPGDTLSAIANRYDLPLNTLESLNSLAPQHRLFPGQPIRLPAQSPAPLNFGAIQNIETPSFIVQGRTGWVEIESTRTLSLTALWNGLPVVFVPVESTDTTEAMDSIRRYRALLPTPALLTPGPYALEITYETRAGIQVDRTISVQVSAGAYSSQAIILPDDKGSLLAPEIVAAEFARLTSVWSNNDSPLFWSSTLARPLPEIYETTSPYGIRRSYDGGPYNSFHAGQDFGAPGGITITAPADGIVALSEALSVRGNVVLIDHGRGIFTGYWHLSELIVQPGDEIRVGEPLGLVGTTGLSTGDHLHWEMRIFGVAVDPLQFLDEPLFPSVFVEPDS